MQKLLMSTLVLLICLFEPPVLKADAPIVDFSSSDIVPEFVQNNTASNNGFGLGFTFSVTEPVTVSSLGIFNGVSGLQGSHTVALYQVTGPNTGNLLATATISPSDTILGSFVYSAISPLALSAGDYQLMTSYVANNLDAYTHDPLALTFDPRIVFGQNRTLTGNNDSSGNIALGIPVFLTSADVEIHPTLNYGWFGPNMTVVEVPEPATIITLVTLGGIALARKRFGAKPKPQA